MPSKRRKDHGDQLIGAVERILRKPLAELADLSMTYQRKGHHTDSQALLRFRMELEYSLKILNQETKEKYSR